MNEDYGRGKSFLALQIMKYIKEWEEKNGSLSKEP